MRTRWQMLRCCAQSKLKMNQNCEEGCDRVYKDLQELFSYHAGEVEIESVFLKMIPDKELVRERIVTYMANHARSLAKAFVEVYPWYVNETDQDKKWMMQILAYRTVTYTVVTYWKLAVPEAFEDGFSVSECLFFEAWKIINRVDLFGDVQPVRGEGQSVNGRVMTIEGFGVRELAEAWKKFIHDHRAADVDLVYGSGLLSASSPSFDLPL